jgi:hypothetical protein
MISMSGFVEITMVAGRKTQQAVGLTVNTKNEKFLVTANAKGVSKSPLKDLLAASTCHLTKTIL